MQVAFACATVRRLGLRVERGDEGDELLYDLLVYHTSITTKFATQYVPSLIACHGFRVTD